MRDLIHQILDLARVKKATYADIRVVRRQLEEIAVKNGKVDSLTRDEDLGFGIRVLFQGAWGFACSSMMNKSVLEKTLGRAW